MKISQLILILLIATLTSCSTSSLTEENELYTIEETTVKVDISEEETALLALINEYRVSIGVNELVMDASIYTYASSHNTYMMEDDAISHSNFNVRSEKVKNTTNAKDVSENVARHFNTNAQVLNGWLNSASHKATLERNHSHTVISITKDSNGNKYYTQLFYNY